MEVDGVPEGARYSFAGIFAIDGSFVLLITP